MLHLYQSTCVKVEGLAFAPETGFLFLW